MDGGGYIPQDSNEQAMYTHKLRVCVHVHACVCVCVDVCIYACGNDDGVLNDDDIRQLTDMLMGTSEGDDVNNAATGPHDSNRVARRTDIKISHTPAAAVSSIDKNKTLQLQQRDTPTTTDDDVPVIMSPADIYAAYNKSQAAAAVTEGKGNNPQKKKKTAKNVSTA